MDCCEPASTRRPDRPHTFLHHAPSSCASCGDPIEGRVVLRAGAVATLVHCPTCGATEHATHASADAYLQDFLARGEVPDGLVGDHLFKHTTSTCPTCLALVEARVVIRDNRVYFMKDCATCGPSEALVSEDASYYVKAYAFARAGTEPLKFRGKVEHGCPTDCGTCDDHEQHTCLPIVEVTDHCNLECPICIVDNQYSKHMAPDDVREDRRRSRSRPRARANRSRCRAASRRATRRSSSCSTIANRPEIGRVVLITNGIRLGKDRAFARGAQGARRLRRAPARRLHRRRPHEDPRPRSDARRRTPRSRCSRELDIPTQLIFVATRGVNDHQIGQVVELFLSERRTSSRSTSSRSRTPATAAARSPHDPMDRLTIPGVIRRDRRADRRHGSRYTRLLPAAVLAPAVRVADVPAAPRRRHDLPFARFVDFEKHTTLLRSSATLPATTGGRRRARRGHPRRVRAPGRDRARPRDPRGAAPLARRDVPGPKPLSPAGARSAIGERQASRSSCTTTWIATTSTSSGCASAAITTRRSTAASCRRAASTCSTAAPRRGPGTTLRAKCGRAGRPSTCRDAPPRR